MYKTQVLFMPSDLIDAGPDDAVVYNCVIRRVRIGKTRYLILAPDTIQTEYSDERRTAFDAIGDEVFQSTVKEGANFIFSDGERVFIFNKNLLAVFSA